MTESYHAIKPNARPVIQCTITPAGLNYLQSVRCSPFFELAPDLKTETIYQGKIYTDPRNGNQWIDIDAGGAMVILRLEYVNEVGGAS